MCAYTSMITFKWKCFPGQIADLTGSYDMSFVFCGLALLISGLMIVFVPQIQRKQTVNMLASSAA